MLVLTLSSRMELQSVYLTVAIMTQLHLPASQVLQQAHYRLVRGLRFLDDTGEQLALSTRPLEGPIACASACSLHETCTSVTYDPVVKTCRRNQQDVYTFGRQNMTSSQHVHYLGKVQQDIKDGNWTLVFRGQANNSLSMWRSFSNSSCRSDDDMASINPAFSSTYPDVTLPHFRSRWLDIWPPDLIDLVKVQLFKDGRADVTLTFNGTGSNQSNWFSLPRLLDASPYTDLTSNVSQFTLGRKLKRMFVISNTSDSFDCHQQAWLIVEDLPNNLCYWSSMVQWPRILYSAFKHQVDFNNRSQLYREADILVVFVKFKKRPGQ